MKIIEIAKKHSRNGEIKKAIEVLENFVSKNPNETAGAHRYLALLYLRVGMQEEGKNLLRTYLLNNPKNLWMKLFYGDYLYYYLDEKVEGVEVYEEIFNQFQTPNSSTMSPYRYILKRLSTYFYEIGDFRRAKDYFKKFYKIKPSDFYATDFLKYAKVLDSFGEMEEAKEVLRVGIETHPGEKYLYDYALSKFPGEYFPYREKFSKRNFESIQIIKIKTPTIKEGDKIELIVEKETKNICKQGDIIVVSSCVTAIAEERVIPVDSIKPSLMAKICSSFVSQKSVPFGGAAPLANPYAMQIAIEETGYFRVALALIIGGISKLFGIRGTFYRIAGQQSALIDDPPAAIPPFDYCIIPGPVDSFIIAEKIKEKVGCEVAIVDANDLGNAWAVGYTKGVDKKLIEEILSSNPSGNEDQTTPIVIVRGVKLKSFQ